MEKSKLPIMVNISFLYLIAWCISPPLSVGTFFRVVAIATSLYLFGWFVYHNKQGVNGLVLISLVIIAIVVMVCLITYQNILSQFQFFIFLFFIILFTLYQDSDCIEIDLSYIITFAMLLYIVWNITSIIGLSTKQKEHNTMEYKILDMQTYKRKADRRRGRYHVPEICEYCY